MAIVHFALKSSSEAPPSAEHADYITRDRKYIHRHDIEWSESGNMPDFADHSPREFWLAADAYERANGRTYTEIQVALPRELSREAQLALAREAAQQFMGGRFAYTMAIHNPVAHDKIDQPHMHLMFSERAVDERTRTLAADQFFKRNGAKKDRDWNDRDRPEVLRSVWCDMMNRAMEKENIPVRVDPRSWAGQGREDLAALVEPKQIDGTSQARAERLQQIEELRELRKELPPAQLDGAAAVTVLEQQATAKIAEIEHLQQQEINRLDRMIAKVKEAMERVREGVRSFFGSTKAAQPAAVSEHKTEGRERQNPPLDPVRQARDVKVFLWDHRKDFTYSSEAERWFDARLEQLSTLQNPATGRALFEASRDQSGRTIAECINALDRQVADKQRIVEHYEGLIQKHEDPRTMWQKFAGQADGDLQKLNELRGSALAELAKPQEELQRIEAQWSAQRPRWEQKAEAMNGQQMEQQQRTARELRGIRADVLSECERRDLDPAVRQARADERHLDYIVTELNAGSDPETVRENLLRWQLKSTSPEAQQHTDWLMSEGKNRVQKQREVFNREMNFAQLNTPKIDYPTR